MYHHVAVRPAGARIKGLYVTPKLFNQQMCELRNAGFSAPDYLEVLKTRPETIPSSLTDPASLPGKVGETTVGTDAGASGVFLTFVDGFVDVFENALPSLRQHGFHAIQFLVADLLGKTSEWQIASGDPAGRLMDTAQVKDWLHAGNEIGSHTLSHPWLTRIPFPQAREEIIASRKKLEDTFARPVHHFCYPYGDMNEKLLELVREAGYCTACTTEFGVNDDATNPFALKRIMARYKSRSLKTLFGLS
jgi:peptidoglycan/xylan/chitin deacetylase (PgdA/CDA1 family)